MSVEVEQDALRPEAEDDSPLDIIYEALLAHGSVWDGGQDWSCPAHDDERASLGVTAGTTQPVLLHCAAGCRPREVLEALGLDWQAVLKTRRREKKEPKDVRKRWVFRYTDEAGRGIYDVIRWDYKDGSKRFAQRPYNARPTEVNGKKTWPSIDGLRRVLYRLPEVVEAASSGGVVWLVEGEKSADLLRWLGETATTQSMGADQKWPDEFTRALVGCGEVRIVVDWDAVGLERALRVGKALYNASIPVSVWRSATVVTDTRGWTVHGKHHDIEDHIWGWRSRDELVRLSAGEVKAAILALRAQAEAERSNAALESPEVAAAARSERAGGVGPGSEWPGPQDDRAVAEAFIARCYSHEFDGAVWRTLHWWWDRFYVYDRRRRVWKGVDEGVIRNQLSMALAGAYHLVAGKDGTTERTRWKRTTSKLNAVLAMVKDAAILDKAIEPRSWLAWDDELQTFRADRGPGCAIAFANGLLDLDTMETRPSGPWFFNLSTTAYPLLSEAPKPTAWLDFLDRTFEDPSAVRAMQEWFGYVLSGDLRMQKAAFIVGRPRTGKGTICHVMEHMIGRDAYSNPDIFALGDRFGMQGSIGKLAAIIGDSRFVSRASQTTVTRLLQYTGGDSVTVDRKNKDPWEGVLSARFTICSNELPNFPDSSGAFVNRFIVFPIPGEGYLGKEDISLLDRLLDEMSGILEWALDGLIRLRTRGRFTVVESSRPLVAEMLDMANPLKTFWDEHMVPEASPSSMTPRLEVYAQWRAWAAARGLMEGTDQTFSRNVRSSGLLARNAVDQAKVRGKKVRVFGGWKLGTRVV